jgi:hypothetical protein
MVECSEDHVTAICSLKLEPWNHWWNWFNWRPGGALRWKLDDHQLGRSGSVIWKVGTSKVVAPPVSVKDRCVGPREQVLNIHIAYQRYGPGEPSNRPLTEGWLYPHYFNGCLGRETGYRPMNRSAITLWIGLGVFFLESSGPAQLC